MPLARIIASNPSTARHSARALREAGYEVEIVPPGTAANASADLVFDVDADAVISQKNPEEHIPGQREFVLKPLWRKFTAKRRAEEDILRAKERYGVAAREVPVAARVEASAVELEQRAAAPAAPERREERQAEEAALAAAEQRRLEKENARRMEEARIQRERAEQEAIRERALQAQRAEELRLQRVREEQEAARHRELEAQRAEMREREEARRLRELAREREELARQREYEQEQLVLKRQEEERRREQENAEAARRAQELEVARQAQMLREREELRQQEAARRQAEEEHRLEVLRVRQEEESARRAEAQRLLIEANRRREESAGQRPVEMSVIEDEGSTAIDSVPTLRQYMNLRIADWKRARAAKAKSNVTPIDHSGAFAWRQAWPITAVVAVAFLLGWAIAAYHGSMPKAAKQTQPPVLTPGQYAPYPVANSNAIRSSRNIGKTSAVKPKRRAVRDSSIAQDEVVVHRYYPPKNVTAQNAPRKKISDLQ